VNQNTIDGIVFVNVMFRRKPGRLSGMLISKRVKVELFFVVIIAEFDVEAAKFSRDLCQSFQK